eukprot:scaffold206257_cov35-Tisochrysis_lutea.AAC.4
MSYCTEYKKRCQRQRRDVAASDASRAPKPYLDEDIRGSLSSTDDGRRSWDRPPQSSTRRAVPARAREQGWWARAGGVKGAYPSATRRSTPCQRPMRARGGSCEGLSRGLAWRPDVGRRNCE